MSEFTTVASHVLAFLIRSIVNPFKFSLSNFATDEVSTSHMFLLLWKAISICEKNSLKVIAVTCDGASPNRKLFGMHLHLTKDDNMNPELMLLIAHIFYLVVPKTCSFTLFVMLHIC